MEDDDEGGGMLYLLALLLLLPFHLWQAQAEQRRLLSPHELNLRRATQPLGLVALLAWAAWQFGTRDVGELLRSIMLNPVDNWGLAALLCAGPLYGLASFIIGAWHCWGLRSDGMLPVWAGCKLAVGVIGLRILGVWGDDMTRTFDFGPELRLCLVAVSIWCTVIGGTRLMLLTMSNGNALRVVKKHIQQTQVVMRPVRRRPWWRFW